MKSRFVARGTILAIVAMWGGSTPLMASAQTAAENFASLCSACHTVGGGQRVGPDLAGVSTRHSREWLLQWTSSSQALVRSGDADAVALFHANNDIVMPDVALSEEAIGALFDYIDEGGPGAGGGAPALVTTPEDIAKGRELFQGGTHLANRGPACSSCHHVANDNVVGGGVLAKELTTAFTRLGMPGIQAILNAPPFPVMQQAYADRPLQEDEIAALGAYLQYVGENPVSYDQPRQDSLKLLGGGTVGLCVLMGIYSFSWRRRKKRLVNQKVFERQVRSQ